MDAQIKDNKDRPGASNVNVHTSQVPEMSGRSSIVCKCCLYLFPITGTTGVTPE